MNDFEINFDLELAALNGNDIPIYVERKDEDAESFIERTFNEIHKQEHQRNASESLSPELKTLIQDTITRLMKVKSKRENYYEFELYKSMKERITFLEEEVRQKNELIFNLTTQKSDDTSFSHGLSKAIVQTQNMSLLNKNKSLSTPEPINVDTPNISITEEPLESNKELIESQLSQVRKLKHNNYLKSKKDVSQKSNQTNSVSRKKVLIIGDSMVNGINKKGLSKNGNNVKVKYFSGAKIDNIYDKLEKLADEKPQVVILHLGTNNSPDEASNVILDKLLSLKNTIEKSIPKCKVILSSLTPRLDNGKANLTIKRFNEHLKQLKLEIIDNSNITTKDLGKKGLHLSNNGKAKLARNVLSVINN